MDENSDSEIEKNLLRPAHSNRLRAPRTIRNTRTQAARTFRKEPTASEALLWQELRQGRIGGNVFRRQHPVGRFIVDFCCPAKSLIVEIDGPIHDSQRDADSERQRYLEMLGYRFLRISAQDVETKMSSVLTSIADCLESKD